METMEVTNCYDCPLVIYDNERGYCGCNITKIELKIWDELPSDKVYEECGLKTNDVLIKLK